MSNLKDMINNMLSEVKQEKKKKKKELKQKKKQKQIPSYISPWQDEALVCLIQVVTCKCCKTEFKIPNPHLFVKRFLQTKKGVSYHWHEIKAADADYIYSNLPKRIEYNYIDASSCEHCFKLSKTGLLQRELDLDMTTDILQQQFIFNLLLINAYKKGDFR